MQAIVKTDEKETTLQEIQDLGVIITLRQRMYTNLPNKYSSREVSLSALTGTWF